ncbi:AraC family transcriptional regulator [Halomonas eurihalina]|uniref:AraC family transcriptional regulator n=1 Tax=Halomonas eurihalina TaxID=42566 RepID=A0A5D9CZG4_HALER|nr:AraC family transcriptional regulator [Halomonas eurihalina]MDR5860909.1 AraC family transcriptional regulator [Halomonas eurihalina]TZG35891.1 AraC family transcriptional regulator [Halomonas eurihalina]
MTQRSQFRFTRSRHVPGLTMLRAAMSDFSYDRHAHEEYAFGVTLAGRQDFFSGGEYHRSRPGTIIEFNPDEVHDGQAGGNDTLDYVMLYADPAQLAPLFASAAGRESASQFRAAETLIHDGALRGEILDLARRIDTDTGSRIDQEYALYRIAARLVQRTGNLDEDVSTGRTDKLLERAKTFIHAHAEHDISLEEISQAAHLSKYHFLRLFRRQFGITPHQYVLNCRINAARSALDAGHELNDVVGRYGFADLSHFNRRFKRIYGMTPRQYQRNVIV